MFGVWGLGIRVWGVGFRGFGGHKKEREFRGELPACASGSAGVVSRACAFRV